MTQSEIKEIIIRLKKNEMNVFDVPEECKNAIDIVNIERKLGCRLIGKRGFDIISNSFFVEEHLVHINAEGKEQRKTICSSFEDFDSYYDFLNGDIYDNACYTFCPTIEDICLRRNINLEKLMVKKSFIEYTIDDYELTISEEEKKSYEKGKQAHKQCQKWIKKFNNCDSYSELVNVTTNYKKSKLAAILNVDFFLFQYVFTDTNDQHRLSTLMEYVSSGSYPYYCIIDALCSIYNPDDIIRLFNCFSEVGGNTYKQKNKLKKYIQHLKSGEIKFYTKAYFDNRIHYFCEEINGYDEENLYFPVVTISRYFESFDEFIKYRNGDLTYCDLSAALECNEDFSKYNIDETTKLPFYTNMEVVFYIKKYYCDGKFYVTQQWRNKAGSLIKEYQHKFCYFFDFVAFLKGDLTDADLLFCDGLFNLKQWSNIDFTGARIRSDLCERFGLQFDSYATRAGLIESFECIERNEIETNLILQNFRDLKSEIKERDLSAIDLQFNFKCQRVYYISDIHLMHKIQNAGCRSKADVIYVIQKIVDSIADKARGLLLIDGDVSSDFSIFQLFVKMLSQTLDEGTQVVFTLGNHELWDFPDLQIDQIVLKYRKFLHEYGMYLLHNELLYKEAHSLLANPDAATYMIKYHDLCQMSEKQIFDRLRSARFVILGGLGFSGYNKEFNAKNGIYRMTVDRKTEIKESKIFEELYNRMRPILSNKNTIILTHTPKKDWCREAAPDKNYVYVSGHTHRNIFHDDGEYRIYSDNQIGYNNDTVYLKSFLIDNDYDCFFDYGDGIYKITSEQYNDFYRGKNIPMTFQREINILYMLKRNGYYCFIHKSRGGSLTILNGGAMKRLVVRDIQYYYDNMDTMICRIKAPLDIFTSFQRRISNIVKKIGGVGTIHGSIVDIDFYNHIYVNPVDLSVTGYWASDIVNKTVYSSIPALLEKNCPALYSKYVKLLDGNDKNLIVPRQQIDGAVLSRYLDTDIYKASREIKKIQKLHSNILTSWYEDALRGNPQVEHTKNKEISPLECT